MKKIIITSLLSLMIIVIGSQSVQAFTLKDAFSGPLSSTGSKAGFDTSKRDVNPVINTVITVVLSFLGVIFLILMIYGGIMWMTSAGNVERVSKAQKIMLAALVGLIIVVLAYAITYFVLKKFGDDTGLITLNNINKLI